MPQEHIGVSLNKINPFVIAPHWLLTSNVSDTAFRIYCILRAHINEQTGEEAYPSKDAIAAMLGMKKTDSLDPHMKQLVAVGAIEIIREQRGARRRNRYRIATDAPRGTYASLGDWYKARKEQLRTNTTPVKTDVGHPKKGNPNPVFAGVGYPPENGVKQEPLPEQEPRIKENQQAPSSLVGTRNENSDEPSLFNDKPEKPKTQRQRGTRLPADFTPTPQMVAWARENTPDADGRYETSQFVDYWSSRGGAIAVKVDWVAAWRQWMRKAQKDAASRAGTFGFSRKPAHRPFMNPAGGAAAYQGAF